MFSNCLAVFEKDVYSQTKNIKRNANEFISE